MTSSEHWSARAISDFCSPSLDLAHGLGRCLINSRSTLRKSPFSVSAAIGTAKSCPLPFAPMIFPSSLLGEVSLGAGTRSLSYARRTSLTPSLPSRPCDPPAQPIDRAQQQQNRPLGGDRQRQERHDEIFPRFPHHEAPSPNRS